MRAWLKGLIGIASFASAFCLSGVIHPAHAYVSPGPALGYVSDFAGVLSKDGIQEMTTLIRAHEASSSQEIAVVTIPRLEDETIESYAVALFKEWGIGKRADNNGVLILVAVEDRKVRIEVGYGLEPVLTDAQSAGLINRVLPLFKASDYNGAAVELTKGTIGILNSDPTYLFPERSSSLIDDSSPWPIKLFFWFCIFMLGGGVMFFICGMFYAFYRLSQMPFTKHKTSHGTIFTTSTSSRSSDWSSSDSSSSSSSSSSDSFGGGSSGGGGASGSW